MTDIPVLRSTTRADLLALPSYLFGFEPTDSVVVIALCGKMVHFSARLDVDWFAYGFAHTADQILNATTGADISAFFILGYCDDPDLASLSVSELAAVVGRDRVREALVTDGEFYWSLIDDDGAHPYDGSSSAVTAQAVYTGINIHATREEAVAPVVEWEPPADGVVAEVLEEIDALGSTSVMSHLEELAQAQPPVEGRDAVRLACLLRDEDCAGAILTRLSTTTAESIWSNLAAARRLCPPEAQPTVVALLGVASWLSGRGAQASACMEQMDVLDPDDPIGVMLRSVHHHAIPPQRWDVDWKGAK